MLNETGDELYNYLLRHGPLPVDKVQRIFTQLVGAVAYVHSKSCVHRDLKLENILLDKHENVKLCDFGFTREYEGKASYLQTFCGTICYSAPEMLKGEKYAGEKVDVWSLGIILYALLKGELPFDEDDDQVTKTRILSEEPAFNDKFPDDAKSLINLLLSKRPLIRPSLGDILAHPFLSEHAAEQQAILKIPQPSPFTTPLEKTTLQRMKSAGVNIDEVVENVLSQRCDPLAGWWALLIEKEQRKEQRRERKRRERESDVKNIRRLSAASSKRLSAALVAVDEEGQTITQERGRTNRRSLPSQLAVPELPSLPEPLPTTPKLDKLEPNNPPKPVDKDSIRSATSSTLRRRPVPPPKDKQQRKHQQSPGPNKLHSSASQPELMQRRNTDRRRRQYPIISQLASLKHWFVESAKRAKSPHGKASPGQSGGGGPGSHGHRKLFPDKMSPSKGGQEAGKKTATTTAEPSSPVAPPTEEVSTPTQTKRASYASSLAPSSASHYNQRQSYHRQPRGHSSYRNSLSPSPMTPKGSYRRSSHGLRGRKSTSSSISSIRSIHHTHTHSKASSVSSNSVGSASTPTARVSKSPHTSVKVLPTTPGASSRLPSNVRLVRGSNTNLNTAGDLPGLPGQADPQDRMHSIFNEAAPAPFLSSPASSLVFARRKRSAFKGPAIAGLSEHSNGGGGNGGGGGLTPTTRPATRKSQIIEEEDDADEEEEIEEVDAFSEPEAETEPEINKPSLAPAPDLPSPSNLHHHHHPSCSSSTKAKDDESEVETEAEAEARSRESIDRNSLTPVASPKAK